jgi:hypothetical protein
VFEGGPLGRWLASRRRPGRLSSAGLDLAEDDVAELSAIGRQVAAEYGLSSPAVLSANLTRLMRRQVPVRAFEVSDPGVGGLQFADGTVVLVRGSRAGDLGRIAAGLHFGPVHLDDFHSEAGQVTLDLSYGGHHDQLRALGVSQPQ